jgi:pilus assembly protein CpaB
MGRRILAIAAAAVIALIGAVLVLLYARGADNRAVAAASPTTVYVSNAAVPAGTSLKEAIRLQSITQTQVAARSLPAGALTTVDDSNSALVALTDIAPGQYVLAAGFGETPTGQKALQVASGKLAVSLSLSDPARVGDYLRPGSFITLFMSYNLKDTGTTQQAKAFNDAQVKGTSVLLDNVKVIAMGANSLTPQQPQTTAGTDGEAAAPVNATPQFLVTVEVTPEDATKLIHGINNYTLYAGLRGSELKVDPRLTTTDLTILPGLVK